MDSLRTLTTKEKALRINMDLDVYGSFAEIGAGQEVAANFFKAGGASGTIAKTISAYDMTFSDAIYGKFERYVCEPRLMMMLDKEFNLLIERLDDRIDSTKFFAFANTVEALNYKRTNHSHGWIGIRFQLRPNSSPNDCVIHVEMIDRDNLWQQQALGIIGVNLIYACFHFTNPDEFLLSLMDDLSPERIEVDMFRLDGPDFKDVDNRLMSLKLVKNGMTSLAMFGRDGKVMQPSEALYRKNPLILRGRFRPVTHVNVDMLLSARRRFKEEPDVKKENIRVISELTLTDLSAEGEIDNRDFLHRVDIICSLGQDVMISNHYEYFRLVSHISRYTLGSKIGIILGIYNLASVFEERFYLDLPGGILESFGILFGQNLKLFVYPSLQSNSKKFYNLENFELPAHLKSLFDYLIANNKLEDIKTADRSLLHIVSDNVLNMIQNGKPGWEDMVPKKVSQAIKEEGLFNYMEPKAKLKVAEKSN